MQTRTFDLLTAPIDPGKSTQTAVCLAWINPRNFSVAPAKGITFSIDSAIEVTQDDGTLVLELQVTNTGKTPARFAAIVTCDTDESAKGQTKPFPWPDLASTDPKAARVDNTVASVDVATSMGFSGTKS